MRVILAQLTAFVGKSEPTVLRRIADKILEATRMDDGTYEVSDELAEEMIAHVGIEERLRRIEEKLDLLLAREEQQPYKQIAPHAPQIICETTETMLDMFEKVVPATVFAALHFPTMTSDQIGRLLQTLRETPNPKRHVEMVENRFKVGYSTWKWGLGGEGRYRFWEANHTTSGFVECQDCPFHDME